METQTEGTELNHLKPLSLTHLVTDAECQLGPQLLSVWASPCDFPTWASVPLLTAWWLGSKTKCPERENQMSESSIAFYDLDFRVTSVAFCCMELSH